MIRKIIKIGNSDGVTIPASAMKAYGLKVGDRVEVFVARPGILAERLKLLDMVDEAPEDYHSLSAPEYNEAMLHNKRVRTWSGFTKHRSRKHRE